MNESEIMVRYSNDNEGIIMLKDIIDLGVSKQYCLEFLKKNNYKALAPLSPRYSFQVPSP